MKNNQLEASDVPSEMMEQMRRQFDMDSRIIEMRTHQQVLVRKGNLQAALQIGQTIEALFSKVVYEYLKEANDEAERIDIGTLNISKEDKAEINTLIVTLFMACDIIESATMDFNDVLKRVDDTLVMEQFDDIRNLSKSAKEKLRYLSQNSKLMKDLGYSAGYKYAHDYAGHFVEQQFLPDALKSERFWQPAQNPQEEKLAERMRQLWGDRYKSPPTVEKKGM